jgi:hypothetical protein
MHPGEQRAIFLMLDALEQQIRNVKSMISGSIPSQLAPNGVPPIPRNSTSYLDDKDEEALEAKMEEVRLSMLKEDERAVQAAFARDPLIDLD